MASQNVPTADNPSYTAEVEESNNDQEIAQLREDQQEIRKEFSYKFNRINSKIDFLADKVGTLVDRLIKPATSPPSQDIMDIDTF